MVDEMQLLATMRSDIPEALFNTDRAERLFLEKVSASSLRHGETGPRRANRDTLRRRMPVISSFLSWGPPVAGALTIAVAVFMVLGTFGASRHPTRQPQGISHHDLPQVLGVLHLAAQEAAAITPRPEPRATQWIYFRMVQVSDGRRTSSANWMRFDGGATAYFQDGKLVTHLRPFGPPHLRGGNALAVYAGTGIPMSAYAALSSLKRSPSKVLRDVRRLLTRHGRLSSHVLVRSEFHFLVTLLWTGALVPTRAQANVFDALARLPGITVQHNQTDAAGQAALAIGSEGSDKLQLLLDTRSYRVLGLRTIMPKPKLAHSPPSPPGAKAPSATTPRVTPPRKRSKQRTVTNSIALTQTAVVARPGER